MRKAFFLLVGLTLALPALSAAAQSTPNTLDPEVCAEASSPVGVVRTELVPVSADCIAMMEAFPRPLVGEVPEDRFTMSQYSFWRVGRDATPTFDAPGGNVIGEIPTGFNAVSVIDLSVEGWLQIEGGAWIQRERAVFQQPSIFRGATLLNGLEYPFAFVLDLSRIFVSQYPGGPAEQDTERWLQRYERVNIFATAYDAEGWRWYMVGHNQWVKQTFVGKVQRTERPEGVSGRWVAVDLFEQTLVAYEDDTAVFATLVSSGLERTETNEGLFDVWARLPADRMSGATGAPNAYDLQRVPWVMYFDGGISLHGTYWHDLFGYRQSRGCVNLTISDARWLYEWLLNGATDPESVTNYVFVHSTGEFGVTATGL